MNKRRKISSLSRPHFTLLFLILYLLAYPMISQGVDMCGWFKNNNPNNLEHTVSSICRWDDDYVPVWLYDGNREYRIYDRNFNKLTERFTNKEVKL